MMPPPSPSAAQPIRRVAVLGIGHELRGDDAAGLEVARRLMPYMTGRPHLLVIETGPVPENFTGQLRRFQPDLVVLVDAALMGEPPGTLRRLNWQEAAGVSFSSHTLPLQMFSSYLDAELGCQVSLLGIQPGGNELGAPLSRPAEMAVKQAVELIKEFIP